MQPSFIASRIKQNKVALRVHAETLAAWGRVRHPVAAVMVEPCVCGTFFYGGFHNALAQC